MPAVAEHHRVALHEAAHSVAARLACRAPVRYCRIDPDGGGATGLGYLGPYEQLFVVLSGREGEYALAGVNPLGHAGHADDFRDAWNLALHYSGYNHRAAGDILADVRRNVVRFINDHLDIISGVAAHLAARGDLSGPELDRIIEAGLQRRGIPTAQATDASPLAPLPGYPAQGPSPWEQQPGAWDGRTVSPIDTDSRWRPLALPAA